MRKLFKKLLAVVLVGAMVGSVACNDYDDDINDLNNRLDEIEGKVAMKADLDALQATVNQLAAIDFDSFATNAELNAAIAKCASKDDIKNFLSSDAINTLIAQAVADMQKQIEAAKSDLEGQIGQTNQALDGLKAMFEAFDAWAEVEAEVKAAIEEALKPYLKAEDAVTIEQVNSAIAEAVKDALTVEDVNATIKAWMGENFESLMAPYKANMEQALADAIKAREEADAALKSDLEKQLEEAIAAVEEAQKGNVEAAEEAIKALNAKIETLTEQLAALQKKAAEDDAALEARLNEQLEAAKKALEAVHAADKAAADKAIAALEEQIKAAAEQAEKDHAALTDELTKLQEADATLKSELTQALEDAIAEVNKDTDAIYVELAAVKETLKAYGERIAAVEEAVKSLDQRVGDLEDKVNALIQNIAFVAEYSDNKATALKLIPVETEDPTTLSATLLTAQFEITPAESAAKIVEMMGSEAQEVSMKIQPLQSRSAEPIVLGEDQLTIVAVEGVEGRIQVTAKVPNMPENYNDYQFALCVKTDASEASSDYEQIVIEDEKVFFYVWAMADGKPLSESEAWVENPYESFVDSYNNNEKIPGWINYDVKFTKAYDSKVVLLGDYQLMLVNEAGETFTTAEVEKQYGATEGSLTPKEFEVFWLRNPESPEEDAAINKKGSTVVTRIQNQSLTMEMIQKNPQNIIDRNLVNCYSVFRIATKDAIAPVAYACYTITGPQVEETAEATIVHIEETGDLAWLARRGQTQQRFTNNNVVVEFAKDAVLDFATVKGDDYNIMYKLNDPINVGQFGSEWYNNKINGNGATIKNLKISRTSKENVGIFGTVIGDIENLKVADSKIEGRHWVGAIAGTVYGNITNCDVENTTVTAKPRQAAGVFDDGDKVGAVVGYLPCDDEAGAVCFAVEGCDVKNVTVKGFRDVGAVVGAANVNGEELIKNNTVADATIVADQRAYVWPGYEGKPNVDYIVGRQIAGDGIEPKLGQNSHSNSTITVLVADGAEINMAKENQPLEISKPFGLAWWSNNVLDERFDNVTIVADIDFNKSLTFADAEYGYEETFQPINNWNAQLPRLVNFDGGNKTISNLVINDPSAKNLALFGSYVGTIKNVKIDAAKITGLGRVAGVAAQAWGAIENCHVTNSTFKAAVANGDDGDKVGAIVAQMQADDAAGEAAVSEIVNCSVQNVQIEGFRDLGAFAGHAALKNFSGNTAKDVTIWVDQVTAHYGSYKPFDTASDYVGRQEGIEVAKEAPEADNVNVYALVQSGNYDLVTIADGSLGIANEAAMQYFAQNYKSYNSAFLFNDITLTSEWTPIGEDSTANFFEGTFDGKGHKIEGLKVLGNTTASGLFGYARGTIKNLTIESPEIYGNHWAAAIAAHLFGAVEGCVVNGGKIIVTPQQVNGKWDDGDKAGALVGYLADYTAEGGDRIVNNTVKGVTVKAFRDVAALVGCAYTIADMSGNVAENNTVIIDVVTGYYAGEQETIGKLIGRLNTSTEANVKNNNSATTTLYRLTTAGTEKLADNEQVDVDKEE